MTFSEYAETCIGKTRSELKLNKSTEWCAEFVSHVITTCRPDLTSVTSISCNDMKKLMLDSGLFYEPDDMPRVDDIGFIDWNRGANGDTEKPIDHVVIISAVDGMNVDYIDGNSTNGGGNSPDGKVCEHYDYEMKVNCAYPDYYLRLKTDQTPTKTQTLLERINKVLEILNEIKKEVK